MKVKIQQFFRRTHSWGLVGQETARELLKQGFSDLEIYPTDQTDRSLSASEKTGLRGPPEDLAKYCKVSSSLSQPDQSYDLQFSYTCPTNFSNYLRFGQKNRLGYWCYEWPLIPAYMVKHHQFADYILTPSQFARDCFIISKFPESKIKVVPHGINLDSFKNKNIYPLKTKKSFKILVNIGQSHLRKNIGQMFQAYLSAFAQKDDVCLVAKISPAKQTQSFDVDAAQILKQVRREFSSPAEIELITDYVPQITELYNACQAVYTLTHCEAYYLPGLEAIAAGKINIAPRYGGQLDYLNDDNSLLVEGKIIKASATMQYWEPNNKNTCFGPDLDDAVSKLRMIYNNYDNLLEKFQPGMNRAVETYTWANAVHKMMELVDK